MDGFNNATSTIMNLARYLGSVKNTEDISATFQGIVFRLLANLFSMSLSCAIYFRTKDFLRQIRIFCRRMNLRDEAKIHN